MAPDRRQQILVGVLVVALAGLILSRWRTPPSDTATSTSNGRARAGQAPRGPAPTPDVQLGRLSAKRPELAPIERNLFRFKPKAAPPPPAAEVRRPTPAPDAPGGPGGPPPVPPIRLKFIGLVETADSTRKIAVLSDGGRVFQGHEGDIIEGQYRILKIGAESMEMAYLDGRGRQIIRLTGS